MAGSDLEQNLGISRRTLIRRGAIVGGTLLWAAPAVQTLAGPALAQGSPPCELIVRTSNGQCFIVGRCTAGSECCDCIDAGNNPRRCPCDNTVCAPVEPPEPC